MWQLTRQQREVIMDVIDKCSMDRASFGTFGVQESYPTNEKEVTPFIRERTRTWRESWIIAPLRDLMERDEKEREYRKGLKS